VRGVGGRRCNTPRATPPLPAAATAPPPPLAQHVAAAPGRRRAARQPPGPRGRVAAGSARGARGGARRRPPGPGPGAPVCGGVPQAVVGFAGWGREGREGGARRVPRGRADARLPPSLSSPRRRRHRRRVHVGRDPGLRATLGRVRAGGGWRRRERRPRARPPRPPYPPPPPSVAGFAHALAATNALVAAAALAPPGAGSAAGGTADTFHRVYGPAARRVAARLAAADPVLAGWIATHLYGDGGVYGAPGLTLGVKAALMVSFLGDADMPDQLFGHAVAGLRHGTPLDALVDAVDAGFRASRVPLCAAREAVYSRAVAALDAAAARVHADSVEGAVAGGGEVAAAAAVA